MYVRVCVCVYVRVCIHPCQCNARGVCGAVISSKRHHIAASQVLDQLEDTPLFKALVRISKSFTTNLVQPTTLTPAPISSPAAAVAAATACVSERSDQSIIARIGNIHLAAMVMLSTPVWTNAPVGLQTLVRLIDSNAELNREVRSLRKQYVSRQ